MPMMRNLYSNVVMDVADDDVPERQGQGYVVISTDLRVPPIVVQALIENIQDALTIAAAATGDNPVLPHVQSLVDEYAVHQVAEAARQAERPPAKKITAKKATATKKAARRQDGG